MPDSDIINAHIRGLNEAKILLDGMLDEIDEDARMIGAVNTVVNDDGKLTG